MNTTLRYVSPWWRILSSSREPCAMTSVYQSERVYKVEWPAEHRQFCVAMKVRDSGIVTAGGLKPMQTERSLSDRSCSFCRRGQTVSLSDNFRHLQSIEAEILLKESAVTESNSETAWEWAVQSTEIYCILCDKMLWIWFLWSYSVIMSMIIIGIYIKNIYAGASQRCCSVPAFLYFQRQSNRFEVMV